MTKFTYARTGTSANSAEANPSRATSTPRSDSPEKTTPVKEGVSVENPPTGTCDPSSLTDPERVDLYHDPAIAHRRRRRLVGSLLALVVGFGLYHELGSTFSPHQIQSASMAPGPTQEVASARTLATNWLTSHHDFAGYTPNLPPGVLYAYAGDSMVISYRVGSTCAYTGLIVGRARPVFIDPTNRACSPALVRQALRTLETYPVG